MKAMQVCCSLSMGCLLAAATPHAHADVGAGTYAITGKNVKHRKYKATLTIMPGKEVVYATKRAFGKERRGIGFKQGNHVFLVFGKDARIALYQGGYGSDKYTGVWTTLGAKGALGSEEAAQPEGEAAYKVIGKNPAGEAYEGTLSLDDEYGVAKATWQVGEQKICGVGTSDIRGAQALVLGHGKVPHLWVYSELEDGTVSGYVIGKIDRRFGPEELTAIGPVKQLAHLAKTACACKVKSCTEAGLATLSSLYKTFKDAEAGEKDLKKIEKSAGKVAKCLVKRGVTAEQLEKALE